MLLKGYKSGESDFIPFKPWWWGVGCHINLNRAESGFS